MTNKTGEKTDVATFLKVAEGIPVIDVRSPSEFRKGHIPGSHNIPLFDDSEREAVGICYKREGRNKAILKGLELTGPSMKSKLDQGLKIAIEDRLLVHCWRGGMRSEAMAWLFSLGGIQTDILEGGYKSYRQLVLENHSAGRRMIILGGLTGSGKTHILKFLEKSGRQVIDLEGIANHKGSAFGSLGQPPQPTSEHFSNILFDRLKVTDRNQPLWLEDESSNIGTVFMPEGFYLNMQNSPSIILLMDVKTRLPRLIEEYSVYATEELVESVRRISKRMGGDNANEAIQALYLGDYAKAIEIILHYYDRTYMFGLKKEDGKNIFLINTGTNDIEANAMKVLEAEKKIAW